MKERGMLFSAAMVRANQVARKIGINYPTPTMQGEPA